MVKLMNVYKLFIINPIIIIFFYILPVFQLKTQNHSMDIIGSLNQLNINDKGYDF